MFHVEQFVCEVVFHVEHITCFNVFHAKQQIPLTDVSYETIYVRKYVSRETLFIYPAMFHVKHYLFYPAMFHVKHPMLLPLER